MTSRIEDRKLKNKAILFDEFSNIFEKLAQESRLGVPIIVEGKRDAEALRKLGVRGEIVLIKSIRGLRRSFEERSIRRVILLPDLDEEGERLLKLVKQSLEGVVKEIDVSYWKKLKIFKKLGFTQVETMHLLLERIRPRRSPI